MRIRTLCIWLPNWPVQRLLVAKPELRSQCVVLHTRDPRRGQRIVAANYHARQRRITTGMPLTEARSLARHESAGGSHGTKRAMTWHWLEHQPAEDLQQLKRLAAECDRFSPRVGYESTDQPGCLYLDASSHHRLSEASAIAREQQLLQDVSMMFHHRGHYASTALADTLSAAWALAHFRPHQPSPHPAQPKSATQPTSPVHPATANDTVLPAPATASLAPGRLVGPCQFVPAGQSLGALYPLPIEALRLNESTVEILHCLGIETIEQLWQLPRAELPARFGDHLLECMDQATGELAETFVAYRTSPPLAVHLHLERPTHRHDLLIKCICGLLDQLVDILKEQNRAALRVVCDLEMTGGPTQHSTQSITVGLFQPCRDLQHLLHLFEMQLERRVIPHPIRYIELTVTVNVQPEQGRVQWLPGMEDAAGANAQRTATNRELSGLVEHLSCRLGGSAILGVRLTAEPQIERAFYLVPLTGGDSAGRSIRKKTTAAALRRHQSTASARPFQLLTPPIQLHPLPGSLPSRATTQRCTSWEQVPTAIRFQGHTHPISQYWGPERIETNWWRGQLVRRDYYRLEDEQGYHWWAFYDLQKHDWYLHGTFE